MAESVAPDRPQRGQGRQALLSAITQIVARLGIDGVTFRSVAAEAGVSPGLATYHFPNRETMLQEAMTWAVQNAIEQAMARPPGESGSTLVEDSVNFVATNPDQVAFQFEVTLHGRRDSTLAVHVRTMYESYFDVLQQSLRVAGLPGDRRTAKLLMALMDGIAIQQLVSGDHDDAAETAALFHRLLDAQATGTSQSGDEEALAAEEVEQTS